jgi:uncharacterized membrane protein
MESPRPARIISLWDLATLAGLMVLACFYVQVLPLLPEPVPTHFDALGRASGWTPKAQLPWLVFGAPLFLWTVLVLIGAAAAMLPSGRSRPVAIAPLRGLLGLGLCLLMGACLLVPLMGTAALFAGVLAVGLCMVLGIVFMVRDAWRTIAREPKSGNYRYGVFYVNPQDPRLWVEKRIGIGWTLNFARPAAVWVMLLILAAIPGLILAIRALSR